MKNTKRRLELYSFYDHTGIALHLEKMAAKGWLIDRLTNFGWIYRRIEPEKLHFAVSFYPKASEFDPEATAEQKTFHDFCEHSGWILAATSAQMQIFYSDREKPIPIETEPSLEVENIHRAAKKSFLLAYFVLLAITLLNSALFVSRLLADPIGLLASSANFFTGFSWAMLLVLSASELCKYFLWLSKARKAADRGEFLDTTGNVRLQRFILCAACVGFLYWIVTLVTTASSLMRVVALLMFLYMTALIILVNAIKQLLKRKKASASVNRAITIASSFILSFAMMALLIYGTTRAAQSGAFAPERENHGNTGSTLSGYIVEPPLTIEDLLDVEDADYIKARRSSESLLLGQFYMTQYPRLTSNNLDKMLSLEYTITDIKAPFLYDLCKNQLLGQHTDNRFPEGHRNIYELLDVPLWGAQEAYRLVSQNSGPMNWYLLCYENRILEIKFDWEPTEEQMTIVAEELGGE